MAVKKHTDYYATLGHGHQRKIEELEAGNTESAIEKAWLANISDLACCSQKGLVERFDSTIGAGTVFMPFGGKYQLTPSEAMCARIPTLKGYTNSGTVMSFGYDPYLSEISPLHGAVYAVIDSLTKYVACGGDYKKAWFTFQEYFEKLREELAELKKNIANYKDILKNHSRKLDIIISELVELRDRFNEPRRTEISLSDDLVIEDADLIPVEDVIITVTNKGYVKRMTVDTYKAQNRGGKGIIGAKLSEDDFVERVLFSSTHDDLLFFSSLGKVFRLKAFQIPYSSRTAKGLPIVNLLNFEENEKLATVMNLNMDEQKDGFFIFATRDGIVKKTEISAFENIRANGIKAILLNEGDELFKVALTDGEKDIVLGSSNGKGIRFSESDIRPMGRISAGVRGLKVDADEKMVGMAIVNTDGDEVVIVTEKGYGKRTNVDAFRVQIRGGKGVKALNITKKNGKMIALTTVRGDEDLLVITDKGMVIRTHLDQIITVGRDTQGVCIIKLSDDQKASSIAIVPRTEENVEINDEYREDFEFDEDYTFLDDENTLSE